MEKTVQEEEQEFQLKLTKGEASQIADLLRNTKSWFTLSKDGALAFMKNIVEFGKVSKEVEEVLKVYIDGIRTEAFIKESAEVETLKGKSVEIQTDKEKIKIEKFDNKIKEFDKEINSLKTKLLAETISINVCKFDFDDLYEIMHQSQNKEINGYGYEILYTIFVKE